MAIAFTAAGCAGAKSPAPERPISVSPSTTLTGIDHVSFLVSRLEPARHFYGELLGLEEVASVHARAPGPRRVAYAVGDRHSIELVEGDLSADGRFHHLAFVGTAPGGLPVADPDGHALELVSLRRPHPTAVSGVRIGHVGFLSGSLAASLAFYRDRLGFQEIWRGGGSPQRLDWVNLRVPGGEDYIELMLYDGLPPPAERGGKNHVCLFVPDVSAAVAAIEARPARRSYNRPIEVKLGRNRKRQVNLFDPDGTRVELMEPVTIDGLPTPPSTAPPPRP